MRFLFVDRIVEMIPGQVTRGIKHVTRDDAYLKLDAHQRPYFIPSLIGETLGQLAAWNVMHTQGFRQRPVAGVVSSASWSRPAYVGETLLLESFIEHLDDQAVQYHSVAQIDGEEVFRVEGALGPLLPMQDFIDDDAVQRQFFEIYRPGDWDAISASCRNNQMREPVESITPAAAPMAFDAFSFEPQDQSMSAIKRISRAALFFPDHFPNKPVLPMTVLLECKLNLAYQWLSEMNLGQQWQVSEFRRIKMNEFVQPGDVLQCQVKVKQHNDDELILSYRSEVDGKRVCVVDIVLVPKRGV